METLEPPLAVASASAAPDFDAEATNFTAGDFVWAGEVKSHPWWPGQVLDPSQVPDHAPSGHRLLVAYFGGDGGLAWCEPSQLKPFVAAEFRKVVDQKSAKSFMAAVGEAVAAIGRSLQFDLTCHCIPVEARAKAPEPQADASAITNYTPVEFLDRLRGVARDVLAADMLEAVTVRSWGLAFGKGTFSSGSFAYHPRREIAALVDDMDIDAPPLDSVGGEMSRKETLISRSRAARKPRLVEEDLYRKRKKRSMAKLIAEMDLDAVGVSDVEGEKAEADIPNKPLSSKPKKGGKAPQSVDAQLGSAKAEQETCVGRRERKKSKYLSPPYTYLSSQTKLSASPTEPKTPKKATEVSWPLHSNSQAISKCTYSLLEEEDKKSLAFKIDGMHATVILSEFLLTALNPLYLKWNRLAKTVKGFLAVYRSSVYVDGSDFGTYQKHLGNVGIDEISAGKDRYRRFKDGTSDGRTKDQPNEENLLDGHVMPNHLERKKTERKRKMRKGGADGVSPLDLDQDATDLSVQGKSWPKRKTRKYGTADEALLGSVLDVTNGSEQGKAGLGGKMRKDATNSEHLLDLNLHVADGLEVSKTYQKRRRNKDGDIDKTVGMGHEPINIIEAGKMRKKMIKNEGLSDSKAPTELGPELVDCREGGRLGQKNGEDGFGGESLVDLGGEVTNSMEAGKTGQKRQNDTTSYSGLTTLLLTFAPGITLPSKEHLVSTFRKYGDLIEVGTELLRDSGCARIVFVRNIDAKKALDSQNKSGAFGFPAPIYRLCHLPGKFSSPTQQIPTTNPPLPYIRNNLERMISTLTGSSLPEKDAGSSDGLKPEARENLVGEMKGLLKKVDKMLKGPGLSPSSPIYK